MSRFLPFAAAILIGIAILAAAHGPGVPIRSDATDRCGDCGASGQSRLSSTGPRLATGSIF